MLDEKFKCLLSLFVVCRPAAPVITLGKDGCYRTDAVLDERIKTRRQLYAFRLFLSVDYRKYAGLCFPCAILDRRADAGPG